MQTRRIAATALDDTGTPEASAVVLIHGLGLNRRCWDQTAPVLRAAGYRVIAPDLYGHGDSGAPPDTPDLALFSRQVLDLLTELGIARAAIVGFSLGGMIARRFAQDHPARTAALGILHSPHRRSPGAQAAILARVEQARAHGPAATVEAALERWFTAPFRSAHPETMALVRSWVLANDPAVYHRIYRVLADGIEEIVAPCPPVGCPALVLTGDEDFGNGPEMSAAIAAEMDRAELYVLKGLRHMALIERPAAVNDPLLAFLARVHPARPLNRARAD